MKTKKSTKTQPAVWTVEPITAPPRVAEFGSAEFNALLARIQKLEAEVVERQSLRVMRVIAA